MPRLRSSLDLLRRYPRGLPCLVIPCLQGLLGIGVLAEENISRLAMSGEGGRKPPDQAWADTNFAGVRSALYQLVKAAKDTHKN